MVDFLYELSSFFIVLFYYKCSPFSWGKISNFYYFYPLPPPNFNFYFLKYTCLHFQFASISHVLSYNIENLMPCYIRFIVISGYKTRKFKELGPAILPCYIQSLYNELPLYYVLVTCTEEPGNTFWQQEEKASPKPTSTEGCGKLIRYHDAPYFCDPHNVCLFSVFIASHIWKSFM